ncbi:MAG: DUF4469 domain-containing protein [Anaerolineae bacterium]|nr:DUF4469 domain-containing protein [Anaerolineae bacterium]
MPIHYVLFENHLTAQPDTYKAVAQPIATAGLDEVIERMVEHGSTVTRADILSVLEDYFTAIEEMVLEGLHVNTPSANYNVQLKGVFNGPTDTFDPKRHRLTANTSPGKRLRAMVRRRARAAKGQAVIPTPHPVEYLDLVSNRRNSTLTPGGLGQLTGYRLKFEPNDPRQGLFLAPAANGPATRVDIIGKNKPGELIFMTPSLAPGQYTLEVRALFGKSEVRAGALPVALTVNRDS